MLAKVITLKKKADRYSLEKLLDYIAGKRPTRDTAELHSADPTAVAEYIAREGVIEGGTLNLDGLDITNVEDKRIVVAQMNHIAMKGQAKTGFTSNPFYHYVLSWREGEQPTKKQVEEAVKHSLKALGMHENQAAYAIHRDTENTHVHIVVNRVNPNTLTLSGPPRYDYFALDKACREIELRQGWQHDNGPYVVIGGVIQRLTRKQREKMALLSDKEARQSVAARMMETKSGLPSLQTWLKTFVLHEMLDAKTWEDLHVVLGRRGVKIEKLKSGLQFVTIDYDGSETRTKASGVDYRFSLARLEKRFGEYRSFSQDIVAMPALTYSRHLENVMRGIEPAAGEVPPGINVNPKRAARRAERAAARKVLYERYVVERRKAMLAAPYSRQTLAQKHKVQMAALRRELQEARKTRLPELIAAHGKAISMALWAAERAKAIADLKQKQQIEKAAMKKATSLTWKDFVRREAAKGDIAAQAALRGINYRDRRKLRGGLPGFEGEDLEDQLSAPSARDKGGMVNAIIGTPKRFSLDRYEIDHLRQCVIYRDEDGNAALEDIGQRIECLKHDDDSVVEAGLLLAAQKYGGEVLITGDEAFKRRAATIAARLGVRVANHDLQPYTGPSDRGIDRGDRGDRGKGR